MDCFRDIAAVGSEENAGRLPEKAKANGITRVTLEFGPTTPPPSACTNGWASSEAVLRNAMRFDGVYDALQMSLLLGDRA